MHSDGNQNLWETLLKDIANDSDPSEIRTTNIILVGDPSTGKRSLISLLRRGIGNWKSQVRSGAKEFDEDISLAGIGYCNLRPELEDGSPTVNVWILDDTNHTEKLFRSCILPNTETLTSALVILTVDLGKPWKIMETLETWVSCLETYIQNLLNESGQDSNSGNASQQSVEDYLLNVLKLSYTNDGVVDQPISLPTGMLARNIGIPIAIVATKSDLIENISIEDVEAVMQLEFIQKHVRSFALSVGASVTYTSTKRNYNCERLAEYLLHRLYPSSYPARADSAFMTIDTSSPSLVHVPAGKDMQTLVDALAHSNASKFQLWKSLRFNEVIKTPARIKSTHDTGMGNPEESCLSMDEFISLLMEKPNAANIPTINAAETAINAFDDGASNVKVGVASSLSSDSANVSTPEKTSSPMGKSWSKERAEKNPSAFFSNLLSKNKK